MKKQRSLVLSLIALAMFSLVAPATAAAQYRTGGAKAGNVSALLPVAKVLRGTGKAQVITEAKKGDEIVWNDLIRTERGGRARITLNDQSILSLGSQAELRVVKHDSRTQQTALQLGYGRVRAEVASVTRDGGRFELRTPTAVAGVIGTDFGSDSSMPGVTTFICISGIVNVSNSDPKVPGTVPCPAGSTTTVSSGLAPTPAQPASQQQIQQLIQDTEPAVISSLSPGSALLGETVVTTASGSKMEGINAVSISGSGVTVTINQAATDTSVGVQIVVAADAAPGPRTLTFTKTNGQATAAIFTVLAPPSTTGTFDLAAFKKAYLEIIEQQRQSAIGGINAIGQGVQQSAGAVYQTIAEANSRLAPPTGLQDAEQQLVGDVAPLLSGMREAGTAINEAAAAASKAFDAAAEADFKIGTDRKATEDEIRTAIKASFDKINGPLLARYKGIHDGLGGTAKASNARLNASLERWIESLKQIAIAQSAIPQPRVDADERSYDVGVMASFDATRSAGTPGATIVSYSWQLCDPSYKPAQIGVPLPASNTACRAMAGFASATSDFKFQTCNLQPQDYIARVTVVDSNNRTASMDVRTRILQPGYEAPGERMHSLANAYTALQPAQFLAFFDESFSGYTSLQENTRRTFDSLASMAINLRLSQASISCNEATVRADWDQNYTFKADQTCANVAQGDVCQRVVFHQTEQLTARMNRVPGKGWFISDFQGNNGTVQGTPPGPVQTDTALPDLIISSLTQTAGVTAAQPENGVAGVSPGNNSFQAVITNVGNAALNQTARVRFSVRDLTNNEIAFVIGEVPVPLAAGASIAVTGVLNVPQLPPGTAARITAAVNAGCVIQERNCDGLNLQVLEVLIGTIDLQISNLQTAASYIGTTNGSVTVDVRNLGSGASLASANNLRIGDGANFFGGTGIPAIPAGGVVTLTIPFIVPNTTGAQAITVSITPAAVGDNNPANDSIAGSIAVSGAFVDMRMSALSFSAGAPPFLSGQSRAVTFTAANAGNVASAANLPYACRLVAVAGTFNFPTLTLASLAPGASTSGVAYTFTVPPNMAGADTFTCQISQDPREPSTLLADNLASLAAQVNLNADLEFAAPIALPVALQMGSVANFPAAVRNNGPDAVPGGWDVVYTVNGTQVFSNTAAFGLSAGATVNVPVNFTVPNVATAPADVSNIASTLQVNANGAIAESTTTNNTQAANLRLVDFTVSIVPSTGTDAVVGRVFNKSLVSIAPSPYPLPVNIIFSGSVPAGLAASGANGEALAGTPSGPAGAYFINANAGVNGVVKAASGSFGINLRNEITLAQSAVPSLTAGGPAQPLTINVTGGIYPVNVSIALPTGITTADAITRTLTGPSSITWNVSANGAASTGGTLPVVITASDNGNATVGVPAGSVSLTASYGVNGVANYTVTSFNWAGRANPATGANAIIFGEALTSANVVVANTGNESPTGSITLTLTCTAPCDNSQPPTATVPAPAAGTSVTVNVPLGSPTFSLAPGSYTGTTTLTTSLGETSTADNTISAPFDVIGSNLNIPSMIFTTGTQPFLSNDSVVLNLEVDNTGSAASAGGSSYSCQLQHASGNVLIGSGVLPVIAAGGGVGINLPFTVPVNRSGTNPIVCTLNGDSREDSSLQTDNTNSTSVQINVNVDLVLVITPPSFTQMGSTFTMPLAVQNVGGDTAPAGANVLLSIGGTQVFSTILTAPLLGGQTTTLSPAVVAPQFGTAPTNSTNYTLNASVNGNGAVVETSSGNNAFSGMIDLVDFALTANVSNFSGVVGRSLMVNPAVVLSPAGYPLAATINYTGLPAGVSSGGSPFAQTLSGTPSAASSGAITASATGSGVTRSAAGSISFSISQEISVSQSTFPTLITGGPSQPLTINVSGGLYPVTVGIALPTGINTGDALFFTLTGPGSVTWNLSADGSASTGGTLPLVLTATDNGNTSAGVPAGNVNFTASYSVNGVANFVPQSFGWAGRPNPATGANAITVGEIIPSADVVVANTGNSSPSGNITVTLTCSAPCDNTNPPTVTVPAPAAGGSVTATIVFAEPTFDMPPGPYTGTATVTTAIAETSTADNALNVPFDVIGSDIKFSGGNFSPAQPYLSGDSVSLALTVINTGSAPSAGGSAFSCVMQHAAGNFTIGTGTLPVIAAGGNTIVNLPFTVPVDRAGTNQTLCTLVQDTREADNLIADNSMFIPVQILVNVDLQVMLNPPSATQMGSNFGLPVTVKNFGADTAPSGANVIVSINGTQVFSTIMTGPLGGGQMTTFAPTLTAPQIGTAPSNSNNYPLTASVNSNAAVTESNTGNNGVTSTINLVDFMLSTGFTNFSGVAGRPLQVNSAIVLDPSSYPLPVTINYSGLPTGLSGSGSPFGQNIFGTPSTTGSGSITASATVNGVTRTSATPIGFVIDPEITISLATAFSLTAGGPAQTLSLNVSGGTYPMSVFLPGTLPTGITTTSISNQSLTGPGLVSWSLQADSSTPSGTVFIPITAADNGNPTFAIPPGNLVTFNPGYSVNGQDNYTISAVGLFGGGHNSPITGVNAVQRGESTTPNYQVNVANVGTLGQTGTIIVTMTCTPACGSPTQSLAAPGAGGFTPIFFDTSLLFALPGNDIYTPTFTITSSPAQSSTADDAMNGPVVEIFDFNLLVLSPMSPEQNILRGGSGSFSVQMNQPSVAATQALTVTPVNSVSGVTVSSSLGSMTHNDMAGIIVNAAGLTTTGISPAGISSTRFGVTRSATQSVNYFDASIIHTGAGDSSGNPLELVINGNLARASFQLSTTGFSGGPATLNLPATTGVAFNPEFTSLNPNQTFYIEFGAVSGATPNVLLPVNISVTIPNSNPAINIPYTIYLMPRSLPDLTPTAAVGINNFASRNFVTFPLLSGEGGDFQVTVQNLGDGTSSSNLKLVARLDYNMGEIVGEVSLPGIPASGSYNATIHVRMPEQLSNIVSGAMVFAVEADAFETSFANNELTISMDYSDWSLDTPLPVNVTLPGPGSGSTNVVLFVNQGQHASTIELISNGISTLLSQTGLPTTYPLGTTTVPVNVLASSSPQAADGKYAVQVVAYMKDGATITARRGATIIVTVNSGITPIGVDIASNRGNAAPGAFSACSTPCTGPVQLNGTLVETVGLTPTRADLGSTGSVDMVFTDGGGVVSNVTLAGTPSNQVLANLPYGSPVNVNFAAEEFSGSISGGDYQVVISASAIQTAQRGDPPLNMVGSNQTTLHYRVGDLDAFSSSTVCVAPNGGTASFSIVFTPSFGFNQNLSWNWQSMGGFALSMDTVSGSTPFSSGYASPSFTITNNETSLGSVANLVFAVTITNANGAGTKYFEVPVYLDPSSCALGASPESGGGGRRLNGSWRPIASGSASAAKRAQSVAQLRGMPDLQIKPVDVSFTPSVPTTGDTVNVRFRMTNSGDASAKSVPVALRVNGVIVATDTFDVAAGSSTLGGLNWKSEMLEVQDEIESDTPQRRAVSHEKMSRGGAALDEDAPANTVRSRRSSGATVELVIDPNGTIKQKSTANKSVALASLQVLPRSVRDVATLVPGDTVILEVSDICVGLRLSGSATECESADVDLSVDDFGNGRYSLESLSGVADLGVVTGAPDATHAQYTNHATLTVGHTYAVQMSAGKVGMVTIKRILSPQQLEAEARKRFGRNGMNILRKMGGGTGAGDIGDTSGKQRAGSGVLVYFELVLQP